VQFIDKVVTVVSGPFVVSMRTISLSHGKFQSKALSYMSAVVCQIPSVSLISSSIESERGDLIASSGFLYM